VEAQPTVAALTATIAMKLTLEPGKLPPGGVIDDCGYLRRSATIMQVHQGGNVGRTAAALVIQASCFVFLPAAGAQTGTLTGSVTDSSGAPIFGAEVAIAATEARALTDERGEFRLPRFSDAAVTLKVRRLGFVPVSLELQSQKNQADNLTVRLARTATVLPPVPIRAQRADFTGRLAGYYQRLQGHSSGYFITREEIDRENPSRLSQLLTHVPGITARGNRTGRGVRMRERNCSPLVWIDGMSMGAGEVDLDAFPPNTIQGIELYLGSTTAPLRYQADRDQSSCGTILLWSRGPDTDPVLPRSAQNWDFEQMVASLAIFTADQVDTRAEPDAGKPLDVKYPPALFAAGVRGSVLAEFVVNTTGAVEFESLGIVSSTHPLFSDAVRRALEGAKYKPAMRRGVAVRQLVQQPFDFLVPKGRSPGA
jgi:TonB family protein